MVAVEVGVERGAHQGVQLDGFTFDQNRLERLNTQTVQGRRTVEHNRVFADHFFQNIPNFRHFLLDQFFRRFHGSGEALHFQFVENKRLKQLQRHFLRQTALVQTQVRTYGNHRTAGIVDTFTQQVLAEAATLTFDHIGQRFERTLVGTGHRFTTAAVVQQRIHCLLQHAFFVAHNDVGRVQFQQAFQAVVTVDDAAVQVVQIGSGETAAVQRYQRTQIRRQYRQHVHNHPLEFHAAALEGFQYFQTLGDFFDFGVRTGRFEFLVQNLDFGRYIQIAQQLTDAFGTHFGVEIIAVLFKLVVVVFFGQQLAALQRRHAGIGDHKGFEIQYTLNVAQGHVQYHTQAGRKRFQKPDVCNRSGQFDVAHALAANLGKGNFHAAFFTSNAFEFQAFVFTAQTFVVFNRAEDFRAEQAVALWLEGTVVDGFRLFHFAVRPRPDGFGRSDADFNGIKFFFHTRRLQGVKQV